MSTVIAFGEVLWDLLPDGPVLGGAPFNFANRIAGFGHDAFMISAVGHDARGDEALDRIRQLGLPTTYIQQHREYPTGTVHVTLNDEHPDYEIVRDVAYDHIAFTEPLEALARQTDCISFGTLAQREPESRATLHTLLDRIDDAGRAIKLLDINLRKACYTPESIKASLQRADLLKLNDDEAREIATMLDFAATTLPEIGEQLIQDWALQHIVITLGAHGALGVSHDGHVVYEPGYAIDLVDPVGSGDAFSAGFIDRLLAGRPIHEAVALGSVLGALVATQRGATQPLSSEQIRRFTADPPPRVVEPALADRIHP